MIIPNLGFGGAQRVFHDLSVCLGRTFDVTECVFNLKDGHAYPSSNNLISLDVPAGKNTLLKFWYFFVRIRKLRRLKESLQIDIAISHLEGADYVNVLSNRREKLLLCIHGSKKYDTAISGYMGWIRKKILLPVLYKRCSKIVTVALGIREELMIDFKISDKKIVVINNGFSLQEIKTKSDESISDAYDFIFNRPVLITHGRVAKEKDHRFLITILAYAALKDKVTLVLIGDGPLLQELIDYSISLGHKTYSPTPEVGRKDERYDVIFLGYQSNPFKFLKRATIFLFPSIFEGFPMALVEAMACELPVIARDCPYGPREILDFDNKQAKGLHYARFGILILKNEEPQSEVEAWANGILELLANDQVIKEYKIKSGRRATDFAITKFNEKWTSLAKEIMIQDA
jgi:glycosyltransferase involved in cell wall biosynthesis